jgi:hypothetical protein
MKISESFWLVRFLPGIRALESDSSALNIVLWDVSGFPLCLLPLCCLRSVRLSELVSR